ncbi:MAG: S9 family peptidase [Anaerolineales bacterium]|nr:S9 family peptidase [Anaerolineales bacterium]
MAKRRPVTAEDLYEFQTISDPQISPDGSQIIFVVQRVDRKSEKKYTNLWLVPRGRGEARQFTYGDQNDGQPRWSPDGQTIAFVSNRANEKQAQIYLLPVNGGEARPLTELKGRIGEMSWSPDGGQLLIQRREPDPDEAEREADPQKQKLGVVARHVTSMRFKFDGAGYLPKNKWQLWTVNVRNGKATQLGETKPFDMNSPRWAPDGKQVLYLANDTDEPVLTPEASELFVLDVASGESRALGTPAGIPQLAEWSPDGATIAYVSADLSEGMQLWRKPQLWLIPAAGGASTSLTAAIDRRIQEIIWAPDGGSLLVTYPWHGKVCLAEISREGGELNELICEEGMVVSYHQDAAGRYGAYVYHEMADLPEVYVFDRQTGRTSQRSRLNRSLLNKLDLGQMEEVWFKSNAGTDLQGWLLHPPGFDPQKQYPSILEVHGGPMGQYGYTLMHEFYYLAAQGYVVGFSNPRGGAGYGEDHAKAIDGDWGNNDYADVMAFADLMAARDYVDTARMGITGGSYGGFITNWVIGHTDRFKAAVTQRSVSNMISMWGVSDINLFIQHNIARDIAPFEDIERYWRQSPIAHIGNATTPTLVIHSEQDLRCHQEQGEQVYIALKKLGVPTELVLFPESPHGLSRTGRTDRRIARLEHIARWFNSYM